MTASSTAPLDRIRIWPGCATTVAQAIWRLQREYASRPANTRYRALPGLVRRYVEPALRTCITKAGGNAITLSRTFDDGGIAATITDTRRLDRQLCHLSQRTHGTLSGSIDTLREMGRWVAQQQPARLVPPTKKKLKGETRRLRVVIDFGAHVDWPYCEHCGQLSELASALSRFGYTPTGEFPAGSPRFCARHNPVSNPATSRRRMRFAQVLRAIKRELSADAVFRAQFIRQAWLWEKEQTGAIELRQEEVMAFAARAVDASLVTDPVKGYARECAFQIARHRADKTEFAIASLRAEGWNQSEIGRKLGLSRQAISLRIRKTSGHYDFGRRSPLLHWWPGEAPVFSGQADARPPDRSQTATMRRDIRDSMVSDYRPMNIGMQP